MLLSFAWKWYPNALRHTSSESSSRSDVLKIVLGCSLASVLIVCLWTINSQRLADFYDYSLFPYSGAFLKLGLRPYVDFQTPIQTLPYRLSWWAESVWGEHLSSLAYANLLLALTMFLSTYALLKRMISSPGAISIALSLAVCTALQHGILWYNPLGLWLVVLTALISADIIRRRYAPVLHLTAAFSLVALCAMTKLNYCAAAAALFGLALFIVSRRVAARGSQYLIAAILLPSAACATGFAIEILSTGVSPASWFHQVVTIPSSRAHTLRNIATPRFWLGPVNDYYSFNAFRGMFTFGAAAIFFAAWKRRNFTSEQVMAAAALAVVWIFAAVIAVSNVDLSSMGAALLPIGLVAVGWAFAPAVDFRRFAVAGVALAALYLLMGFVSLFTHSRLLYGPVRAGRSHTFVDGPAFNGYLSGVKFTPETANEVKTAMSLVRQHSSPAERIVWGPGLEMMARQFGTVPISGLPLWFHLHTTLEVSDTKRIIAAWNAAGVTTVIIDAFWIQELPKQLVDYLRHSFHETRSGNILVYDRAVSPSLTSVADR